MVMSPILYPGSEPIVISVSPAILSESVGSTNGTTSGTATISISGGLPPYTAIWVSDNGNVTPTTDYTVTSTTFDWVGLAGITDTEFAVIAITVYDAILNSATYNYQVTITRTH